MIFLSLESKILIHQTKIAQVIFLSINKIIILGKYFNIVYIFSKKMRCSTTKVDLCP